MKDLFQQLAPQEGYTGSIPQLAPMGTWELRIQTKNSNKSACLLPFGRGLLVGAVPICQELRIMGVNSPIAAGTFLLDAPLLM